jgi:hypothetical protein
MPTETHTAASGSSKPMPMMSSKGLLMAIVIAKARNGTPSTFPIISAECSLSMGSR